VGLYATKELISQARKLAADYRRTVGRPLPAVGNEIAEFDAISLLGLEAVEGDNLGHNAIDPQDGHRVQIKSRTLFDEAKSGAARIGQLKMNQQWDTVVLVLMDEDYEPFEIYEAERDEIQHFMEQSSGNRAKRGALSVARFKIIGQLRWTRENGLEDGYWANQA
jgi:hypothetical protein